MVPRWGGVYVYNPKDENQLNNHVQIENPMRTFITQFINLIGISLHQVKYSFYLFRSNVFFFYRAQITCQDLEFTHQ